ncbi:hypothetical protein NW768_002243 [Fusarium equiseti]|uniref:Ubiquitin-like domain-containing protein n=1 Tax=Fusarium equiseti TaxID=61235 RepID=A0ABQ8RMX0_FUSEQ|nr:hypothetical protein NW768_002243 [Fusarium equiseti]
MISTIAGDLSSIRAIVMGLDRGLTDEYFVLEDITGRMFPIHFRTITSWAVLEFILSERFKGKKGARRVQRKLYSLRESNTQREIDGSIPWESAFLPHQKITMSLICKEADDKNASGRATTSCPFCKTPSDHDSGVEVECVKCKRFFTRVVEVDDGEPPNEDQAWSRKTAHSSGHRRSLCGIKDRKYCDKCQAVRRHRSPTSPKSGSDSEIDSDDEDLQGFVRVQLVSRRRQIAVKVSSQADPGGYFRLERMSEAERSLAQGREQNLEEMIEERTLSLPKEVALGWTQYSPSKWPLSDRRAARRRGIDSYRGSISTFADDSSEEENEMSVPLDEAQIQLDMFLASEISRNFLGTG